ncbi:TrlF family AAA-like ATPase [Weissella minor]|uniref:Atpase involved in dna repair n=1 Tax=Weissella minor TaxID=1620 RepID=A0A0R2JLL6_9LACO|nr:hypothetical protein [Weissella minor]KRN78110.1 atpase involved in dna repair [Weissella minor]
MNRGSEFRKWDLHIHSLYSNLNNNFEENKETHAPNKERYLEVLKDNGIAAIGLTNYFNFSDDDFELQKYLEKNGITTFLNLELRLSNINKSDQLFDYHIIFNNTLDHKIIQNVLAVLHASTGPNSKPFNFLTTDEIRDTAHISLDTLLKELSTNSDIKGQYLTGFLSRGHGSATSDATGKSQSVYEEVCSRSDLIIHSSCNDPATCTDPHCSHNNLEKDRDFWLHHSRYVKPLLQSSDAHSFEDIGTKFSWIKADTTFNGLKQILFEPEDRICLDKKKPQLEKDELVIDRLIYNDKPIALSEGLNSIIGGRGNGKSTLLNSIGKRLDPNFPKEKYDLSQNNNKFDVIWRDQTENTPRKIEYIGQNYMFDMSTDPNKLKEMINDIIIAKQLNEPVKQYNSGCMQLGTTIEKLLKEYFSSVDEEKNLQKPEVEKDSAEKRLHNYQEQSQKILSNNNLTDSDKTLLHGKIEEKKHLSLQLANLQNQLSILSNINTQDFRILYTGQLNADIDKVFSAVMDKVNNYAQIEVSSTVSTINTRLQEEIVTINNAINNIKNDKLFKKGEIISQNSTELANLNTLIQKSEQELLAIETYEKNLKMIRNKKETTKNQIIEYYKEYESLREELSTTFEISSEGLEIKLFFKPKDFYNEFDFINGQGHAKNDFINRLQDNFSAEIDHIFDCEDLKYNAGKSKDDLIKHFFSTNFYEYNYSVVYQGDEFQNMSPGKRSFVILKLILDFSDSKVPVLIDQPEDNLDNRSIYNELTQYLRRTKKVRQIIVVTHNPNVVVGADSENIIVANKTSMQYPNENDIEFDYINGSLEDNKSSDSAYFLSQHSIQDHIFDILEGGKEAFKKRERKYIDTSLQSN